MAQDKREEPERRRKAELALKAIAEAEAAKLAIKEAAKKRKEELGQKRLDKLAKQLGTAHHVAGARSTQTSAQGLKGNQREYILIAAAPVRQFMPPGVFGYSTPKVWTVYVDGKDGPKTIDLYDGKHDKEVRLGALMGYQRVIDNIVAKTLAYQGVTEEAVLEPQPRYLDKNVGSDVLNTKQKEIK